MNDLQTQLKELRDIHLPDPVSFWPLAPGWWALLVILPVLYFFIRYIVRWARRPKYKKLAMAELAAIEVDYAISKDATKACGEISLLIRRALVAKFGNQEVAGLVEEEWLSYLDKLSKTDCFTSGSGRFIVSAPYQKHCEVDINELLKVTKKLLGRL